MSQSLIDSTYEEYVSSFQKLVTDDSSWEGIQKIILSQEEWEKFAASMRCGEPSRVLTDALKRVSEE